MYPLNGWEKTKKRKQNREKKKTTDLNSEGARRAGAFEQEVGGRLDLVDDGLFVEEVHLVLGRVHVDVDVLRRDLQAQVHERVLPLAQVRRVHAVQRFLSAIHSSRFRPIGLRLFALLKAGSAQVYSGLEFVFILKEELHLVKQDKVR